MRRIIAALVGALVMGLSPVYAEVTIPKDSVFIHQYLAPDYWNGLMIVNNDPAFPIVSEQFFVNGVEILPEEAAEHMVTITVGFDNHDFRQLMVCWIKHSTGAPFHFGDVITVVVTDSIGNTQQATLVCNDATRDGEFRCLRRQR